MEASQPASTVGSKKKPLPPLALAAQRRPPAATEAPRATASATSTSQRASARSEMSGPTCTPGTRPSPTRSAATRAARRSTKRSCSEACTKSVLAHTHVWPALRNLDCSAPSTALSTSASAKTMKGALPPSSSERRLSVGAQAAASSLPTPVEPVKLSLRTSGAAHSTAAVSSWLVPSTTFSTPGGSPASCATRASASAESGVSMDGRSTTVQPAASAGASLRAGMAAGKFHGDSSAHGPTGCCSTSTRRSARCAGSTCP